MSRRDTLRTVAPSLLALTLTLFAASAVAEPLHVGQGGCTAPDCELVYTFSQAMVSEPGDGPDPVGVAMRPSREGGWSWRTDRQLVFTPEPGQLTAGRELRVWFTSARSLGGTQLEGTWEQWVQVPPFSAVGKAAWWPVTPGKPRLVAVVNDNMDRIGSGPLLLLYDQPVRARTIARKIRLTHEGRRLPARVLRPRDVSQVTDQPVDLRHFIAVVPTRLPADGKVVQLRYPTHHPRSDGHSPSDADGTLLPMLDEVELTVSSRLEVLERPAEVQWLRERNEQPQSGPIRTELLLATNNRIPAHVLDSHLRIEPQPRLRDIRSYASGEAYIALSDLVPGTEYRVTLRRGATDILGNALRRSVVGRFRTPDKPALLALAAEGTYERSRAQVPIRLRNVRDVSVAFYPVQPAEYLRGLGAQLGCSELVGGREPARTSKVRAPKNRNEVAERSLDLRAGSASLACIEVSGVSLVGDGAPVRVSTLINPTALGVTTKAWRGGLLGWVTHLQDGAPAAGVAVRVLDASGRELAGGSSAADGVFAVSLDAELPLIVVAVRGDDTAISHLTDPRMARPWQFGLQEQRGGILTAAVLTERGVYRPGETVHLKVIVRDPRTHVAPDERRVNVEVVDPRGKRVADLAADLDRYGTFAAEVPVKEGAPVGSYSIRVRQADRVAHHTFRVEEYRVPDFEVRVAPGEAAWRHGAQVDVIASARYLHGGRLSGRHITYQVSRAPAPLRFEALQGFSFSPPDAPPPETTVAHGTGRLDGQGQLAVRFTPDHGPRVGPMRYVVEATVSDVDARAFSGRVTRIVHPTELYLGVKSLAPRAAGDPFEVPVVAVDQTGDLVAGVAVEVVLERADHHTVARVGGADDKERLQHVVFTPVARCRVRTGVTPRTCALKAEAAGQYRVVARATEPQRRGIEAGVELLVSGDTPASWPRFSHERIELVADKASYQVGDTARLIVQTPFPNARGLLTIEREDVLQHRLIHIQGNTPVIEIPITADMTPNVYASIALLRGREHGRRDALGHETGAPEFRVGYAKLVVQPTEHRLTVEVLPTAEVVAPGGSLGVDIRLTDAAGRPVSGQATVMVVDEAVLGLTAYRTPDLVRAIFQHRGLGVRTAESRLELPHARRARRDQVFVGGGGPGDDDEWEDGDGKADGDLPPPQFRRFFQSTAYWNPNVTVDASGKARVDFDLPDNVTAYRVMVLAVDTKTAAGGADVRVKARKPLLLQAVTPRFVYPDDELRIGVKAFNGTLEPADIQVTMAFEGLDEDQRTGDLALAATQQRVEAGGTGLFMVPVRVSGRDEAVVRFTGALASSDGLSAHADALEVRLPIRSPGTRRKVVRTVQIQGDGTVEVELPADRIPGTGRLEVLAAAHNLAELRDAVGYIMGYPNGCIEQTTSTAYPLVVLKDLLPRIGVKVDPEELQRYAEAGVRRLLSFQTTAGGLSYWPGKDEPHAFGTAFGLTALIAARDRGFDVPVAALGRMADYLDQVLKSGPISEEMPHGGMADADTRALLVLTLGRLGRKQPGYVSALWRNKDKLTPFGLGMLAVAAEEMQANHPLVTPILDEVMSRAQQNADSAWYGQAAEGGWSFGSALRGHAAALLAHARAGGAPGAAARLMKGLMARRKGGLWGNTQENVFSIMAVATLVGSPTSRAPEVTLALNGQAIPRAELTATGSGDLQLVVDEVSGSRQALQVSTGGAGLFVTLRGEYEARLTDADRAPTSDGFTVTRHYETLDGRPLDGSSIELGSQVRVRLVLKAESQQHYVALEDLLPAGLEALNTHLATSGRVSMGPASEAVQRGLEVLSYDELRDHRVAFFINELPAGTTEYRYVARATTAGAFLRPAARAEAMYQPSIEGRTATDRVVIQ